MSLAIKYERVEDASMRLRNTVVLYKGAPVLVTNVVKGETKDEILRVSIREIPTTRRGAETEEQRKYISSKHFDIAPFRMGYVNRQDKAGAFYCRRLPNRIQKQGLCGENFQAFNNYGHAVDFNTFLSTKEVNEMVAGVYPSFNVALKALDKAYAVAFSRNFCLVKDEVLPNLTYIYHKAEKVGLLGPNKEAMLPKRFECLKESLVELGVRVQIS